MPAYEQKIETIIKNAVCDTYHYPRWYYLLLHSPAVMEMIPNANYNLTEHWLAS